MNDDMQENVNDGINLSNYNKIKVMRNGFTV